MVVRREAKPDRARIRFGDSAVATGHTEGLELHTLAVQHPEDVVIRDDQQRRRIGERLVVGEPSRIGMAVRTDDRQIADRLVQMPRDLSRRRIGREKPIRMKQQRLLFFHRERVQTNAWRIPDESAEFEIDTATTPRRRETAPRKPPSTMAPSYDNLVL